MARKKHGHAHEEHISEAWLIPYADLLTLLLALFIALFAMSQTDATKVQQMAQAFTSAFNTGGPSFFSGMGPNNNFTAGAIGGPDNGNGAYLAENQALEEVQKKMEEYAKENNLEGHIGTELSEEGLLIRLSESALFASGSARLEAQAQGLVPVIAGLLASIPETITISGHTDNMPIMTAQYPSNWELSSARAVSFMRGLMAAQPSLNPARFSALGYSEYRPIATNDTEEGRAQNRRVEVFIARSLRFNPEAGAVKPSEINSSNGFATERPVDNSATVTSGGLPATGSTDNQNSGSARGNSNMPVGFLPDPLSY